MQSDLAGLWWQFCPRRWRAGIRTGLTLPGAASGFINACTVQVITKANAAEKEKGIHSLIFLTGGHNISSCYSHHTIAGRMNKAEAGRQSATH